MSRGETTTTYFSRPHGARLGAHSRSLSRDTNMTASAQAMDCSRLTPRRRAVADVYTACVETHLRGYDVCYVIAQAPQPVSPYPRTCAPVRNRIHRAPYAHARPRSSHTRSSKRTSTSPGPWPFNPQVVNELLWVAAKRTFTSPGPWPLSTLRVRGRERVAGLAAKERAPSLPPSPFVCRS